MLKLPKWNRTKTTKVVKKEVKPAKEVIVKKKEAKKTTNSHLNFNADALQDTTDYLNDLLFKGKKHPLNYQE
jgi:hypothetical protein